MIWTLLIGTNRPNSNTRLFSTYFHGLLEAHKQNSEKVEIIDLAELPSDIFDPECYAKKPQSFAPFQEKILRTNGLISVLPEYNGGPPGIYKYFIDMLSFPDSLYKKPAAFVGISAGRFGALRPVEQMQQIFCYRNALLYPERVFINHAKDQLDTQGRPSDSTVRSLLEQEVKGFFEFARKLA